MVHLTPGDASGARTAPDVLAAAPGRPKRLIADRGGGANRSRRDPRGAGTTPLIPGARSRERAIRHDPRRCKDRRRIEAAFCRLEDFRRAATRYGKLAANLAAAVARAALVASWC